MSLGAGMPRIPKAPKVPRAPRAPRIRNPKNVATAAVSRNPLVRAWRRIRSNRLVKRMGGAGDARASRPASAPAVAASTAVEPTGDASVHAQHDAMTATALATASVPAPAPAPGPRARARAEHHHPGPDATRKERRRARRAARKAAPSVRRMSRRERRVREGALWRSVLEVGRAQWPDGFDTSGLDPRFIPHFDARRRVIVTVPRPEGDRSVVGPGGVVVEDLEARRVLVGHLAIAGFDPDGQRFVGADPSEGRIAQRPVFVLHTTTLREPIEVDADMRLEGFEQPNGRFRVLADSTVEVG
jgi:hypothetical protein